MRRSHILRLVGLVVFVAGASPILAQDPAETSQVLRGEIVDPAAYLKTAQRGAEVSEQTYEAVDGGQTLALLEEDSQALYLLLAEEPGEDPNELAYDFVNQQVTVQGTVYERGGLRGIVATAIEPVETVEDVEAGAAGATY